jgi:preprotein translocase subunit YajC
MFSLAYAMGAPAGGAGTSSEMFAQFIPLVLMIAVFWFLLIRPQKKRQQEHKLMLENLRRGENVVTAGGLIGRIVDIDGDVLTLDLGGTKVSVGRGYVTGIFDPKTQQAVQTAKEGKKGKAAPGSVASKEGPAKEGPAKKSSGEERHGGVDTDGDGDAS